MKEEVGDHIWYNCHAGGGATQSSEEEVTMGADDVREDFDVLVRCAGYDGEEREELATRVAEMLLSSDPKKVREGVLLIWRVADEISAANAPWECNLPLD